MDISIVFFQLFQPKKNKVALNTKKGMIPTATTLRLITKVLEVNPIITKASSRQDKDSQRDEQHKTIFKEISPYDLVLPCTQWRSINCLES